MSPLGSGGGHRVALKTYNIRSHRLCRTKRFWIVLQNAGVCLLSCGGNLRFNSISFLRYCISRSSAFIANFSSLSFLKMKMVICLKFMNHKVFDISFFSKILYAQVEHYSNIHPSRNSPLNFDLFPSGCLYYFRIHDKLSDKVSLLSPLTRLFRTRHNWSRPLDNSLPRSMRRANMLTVGVVLFISRDRVKTKWEAETTSDTKWANKRSSENMRS